MSSKIAVMAHSIAEQVVNVPDMSFHEALETLKMAKTKKEKRHKGIIVVLTAINTAIGMIIVLGTRKHKLRKLLDVPQYPWQ